MSTPVDYNPYNPLCTVNPCLQWVAGYVDNSPVAQYASCTSLFGSPTVETVTPAADVVFSTVTSKVSYVDIIVSVSTTTTTNEEVITSTTIVDETATAYTTTLASTITTTAVAPTYILAKKDGGNLKKKKKKRGACKPFSSTPATLSSSTTSPTSSASICPSLEDYLSACACINAVSSTKTVSGPASLSTSIIYETVSSAIPSVSSSVVTVAVMTVVVQPATTTHTSTLSTAATTLTAVTTTTTPIAPTQTANIVFANGARAGKPLNVVSSYVQWANTGPGSKIAVSLDGGSPWLPGQPAVTLHLHSASSNVGVLYFETAAVAASYRDLPVTCTVDRATGYLSCSSTGLHNVFLQCGAYVYLAAPTFIQSGCTRADLQLNPWLA